ncbi:3853_t:CDS:1, partial [Paraglomus brasilianum]
GKFFFPYCTSFTDDNNQSETDSTHSTECIETVDQPSKKSVKWELRSSNANKKISDLASTNLNLPTFEDQK